MAWCRYLPGGLTVYEFAVGDRKVVFVAKESKVLEAWSGAEFYARYPFMADLEGWKHVSDDELKSLNFVEFLAECLLKGYSAIYPGLGING